MEIYSTIQPNYIPEYFKPWEVVNKDIYERSGVLSFRFIDRRILWTADRIREQYGKMICNDWYWGGQFDSRGFRAPDDPDGAKLSAHKRGMAIDLIPEKTPLKKIREDIKKDVYPVIFTHINLIENDVGWLHISCENVKKLTVISP